MNAMFISACRDLVERQYYMMCMQSVIMVVLCGILA